MSTNAYVGIVENDTIKYIYVHWDGYPEHTGKMLLQNYNTPEKINELIEMGDCSSLDNSITSSIFYHRDKKEDWEQVKFFTESIEEFAVNVKEDTYIKFVYLYIDGIWSCNTEVMTPEMCGIKGEPKEDFSGKDITEVFDVTNLEHLKEFEHLTNIGTWKQESIFKNCKFPQMWQIIIINKLAMAYLEDKLK